MAVRGTTKFNSNKQERKVASEVCGKTVIASGSLWGSKGDVRSDLFLVECKTTSNSFYSLKKSVWDKIRREATKDGLRLPVMCIDLCDGSDRVAVLSHYPVFPVPDELEIVKVVTDKMSFRVTKVEAPTFVTFNSARDKSPLSVVLVPWHDFISLVEEGAFDE